VTRIDAVRYAITELEKKRRVLSSDQVGLRPLKGAEEDHRKVCEAILSLKEICQALQAECVKRSIAVWQEEIMEEPDAIQTQMKDLMMEERRP